jgi:hypothetical protein
VVPGRNWVKLYYTAPDGNSCRVGISTNLFASTDDAGDTSDSQKNPSRKFVATSLSPATTYLYRITCGPLGGASRTWGSFNTTN